MTPMCPLALPVELGHTTNSGGIGGRVGPMRSVLSGRLYIVLRCDSPGKTAATKHPETATRDEMPTAAKTRRMNGGHAVVDCLRNEGVRYVFNVPGESFTSILDGMRDTKQIQLISNRHEGGACLMAEAYAKATRT